MPAMMVSPPRTSGLPAARATLASRLSSSGAGGFCGGEGGVIVRMVRDLFHILYVPDNVVLVQDENRAALDAQVLDQRPVRFPERPTPMIGQHPDPVHAEGATPAFL